MFDGDAAIARGAFVGEMRALAHGPDGKCREMRLLAIAGDPGKVAAFPEILRAYAAKLSKPLAKSSPSIACSEKKTERPGDLTLNFVHQEIPSVLSQVRRRQLGT